MLMLLALDEGRYGLINIFDATDANVTDQEFSLASILQLVLICRRGEGRGMSKRYFSSLSSCLF